MKKPVLIYAELHADSFLQAYRRCIDPAGQGLGTPALICAALSAELGLKAILSSNGISFGREHNLRKLLDLVPPDDRTRIVEIASESYAAFEEELTKAAMAFIEWRYIYESEGPKEVNVFFVGALANAINQRIAEIRNAT